MLEMLFRMTASVVHETADRTTHAVPLFIYKMNNSPDDIKAELLNSFRASKCPTPEPLIKEHNLSKTALKICRFIVVRHCHDTREHDISSRTKVVLFGKFLVCHHSLHFHQKKPAVHMVETLSFSVFERHPQDRRKQLSQQGPFRYLSTSFVHSAACQLWWVSVPSPPLSASP